MRRYLAKMLNTIVFLLKGAMYICLLLTFMIMFSFNNFAVLTLSRTMATTVMTFTITGELMVHIYGKYDIGRRKSKPIIYSMFLATLMTDIVTYGQLMIMNKISFEVDTFKWIDVWTLFGVLFVQLIIITIFAYAGNGIFFKIIPPEKCIIITTKESDLEKISRGVQKYKKQYRISRVVDYRRSDLEDILLRMETAILYDLPREKREYLVNFCYEHLINIYMNPEIPDVVENLAEHYLLDDVSMLNANVQGLTFEQRVVKRTFDIVLSLIGIILTSPILVFVAIAI